MIHNLKSKFTLLVVALFDRSICIQLPKQPDGPIAVIHGGGCSTESNTRIRRYTCSRKTTRASRPCLDLVGVSIRGGREDDLLPFPVVDRSSRIFSVAVSGITSGKHYDIITRYVTAFRGESLRKMTTACLRVPSYVLVGLLMIPPKLSIHVLVKVGCCFHNAVSGDKELLIDDSYFIYIIPKYQRVRVGKYSVMKQATTSLLSSRPLVRKTLACRYYNMYLPTSRPELLKFSFTNRKPKQRRRNLHIY